MTNIALGILIALDKHKEIHGIETLACMLNTQEKYVRRTTTLLAAFGWITIIPGSRGRGHKTVFRDCGVIRIFQERQQQS